jgi:hypothetical protein
MVEKPNKISHFLQELKRRKVLRVITVYPATCPFTKANFEGFSLIRTRKISRKICCPGDNGE